jgi:uncharacterized membrane protein YraQ (UPF0718 family)
VSFEWKPELKPLGVMLAAFLLLYYAPLQLIHAENFAMEALYLAQDYARLHVVTCLVPAFFIAGAISVFISQAAVIKYFGPKANKPLAYGVASVSGAILAVCSCTVLPLFAGIYTMGAGIGPATTFLYSGPAINVLAVILTARVLGMELGIARAVGAVVFSLAIGLLMHFFFRRSELKRSSAQPVMPDEEETRPLWQNAVYFALLVVILVFANWGSSGGSGAWELLYTYKWWLTGTAGLLLGVVLASWLKLEWWKVGAVAGVVAVFAAVFPRHPLVAFGAAIIGVSLITSLSRGEPAAWFSASWGFAKQILPLLLIGVLVAGALLGRPGHEGLIPSHWIASAVGGNSLPANLFASVAGALMYFATLTEVPILQGLIGSGMGKGPALALLLAGPAVSLPNLLVIRSIMGTRKTLAFLALVVIMATIAGYLYGVVF